jgi:hypothetical protein
MFVEIFLQTFKMSVYFCQVPFHDRERCDDWSIMAIL